MALRFFGGVRPADKKFITCDRPIEPYPTPEQVCIPMVQHIGAPCQPLVKVGQQVQMGQKIGDNEGLCAPIHASVSGKVVAIAPKAHAVGVMLRAIVLENDGLYTPCEQMQPRSNADDLSDEELLRIIHEAGVVGMGGATFPTHAKIASSIGKVDTVIINGSECEPYITADDRLMQEYPEKLLGGVRLVLRLLKQQTALLAVEDNKKKAIAVLQETIGTATDIQLRVLRAGYPQGSEKQLIQALTGRQQPPQGLPADVQCAVFNVATCVAIYDAVYLGQPLIRRVVTVSGEAIAQPGNFMTAIGTSMNDMLDTCGLSQPPYKVLNGGPMMGQTLYDLSAPVIKNSNALTVLGFQSRYYAEHTHCIHCGRCIEVCPMHLMPLYVHRYERRDDLQQLRRLHAQDCIECGCCAYTCPAKIPLVQSCRAAKQKLKDDEAANSGEKAVGIPCKEEKPSTN